MTDNFSEDPITPCPDTDLQIETIACGVDSAEIELYRLAEGVTHVTLTYYDEGGKKKLELPVGHR